MNTEPYCEVVIRGDAAIALQRLKNLANQGGIVADAEAIVGTALIQADRTIDKVPSVGRAIGKLLGDARFMPLAQQAIEWCVKADGENKQAAHVNDLERNAQHLRNHGFKVEGPSPATGKIDAEFEDEAAYRGSPLHNGDAPRACESAAAVEREAARASDEAIRNAIDNHPNEQVRTYGRRILGLAYVAPELMAGRIAEIVESATNAHGALDRLCRGGAVVFVKAEGGAVTFRSMVEPRSPRAVAEYEAAIVDEAANLGLRVFTDGELAAWFQEKHADANRGISTAQKPRRRSR